MFRKGLVLSVCVLVVCAFQHPVWAAWSTDPNVNLPVCTAAGSQQTLTIIPDGAGGAYVAWQDWRSDGTAPDIYTHHVLASGVVDSAWPTDGMMISTMSRAQQLISDGTGGAILTWYYYIDEGTGTDIYAQRVNAAGTPLFNVGICTAPHSQWNPTLVTDGVGGAIITWEDNRTWPWGTFEIYAQRVNASGLIQWSDNGISLFGYLNAPAEDPKIVSDGTGGAIVIWNDWRGNADIYAQRVNAAGERQWTTNGVPICTALNGQDHYNLISDGANGAIVVWADWRQGTSNADIYAQHVLASGIVDPNWPVDGVGVCVANGNQWYPALVSDGSGGAVVVWEDHRSDTTRVYVQHINAAGVPSLAVDGVALCSAVGAQYRPTLISDGDGGAIVVWEDYRTAFYSDIYAQHVLASGVVDPIWPVNGRAICTNPAPQDFPAVTADGTGGAIIMWEDYRSGSDYDIYAGRVDHNGQLGGTVTIDVPAMQQPVFVLGPAQPNPTVNGTFTVCFTLPSTATADLDLLDIVGRRIAMREVESLGVGSHTIRFGAGMTLPPGLYFIRLTQGSRASTTRVVVIR